MAIIFNNLHSIISVPDQTSFDLWLNSAALKEGFSIGQLNYTFLTDDALLKINLDFLDHDTYTDIITFDYSKENIIFGEIFISLDRVIENSILNNCSYEQEFSRILVHGLLHLMGYHDKKPHEKELMTQKEDYYLSLLPQNI